MILRVNPRIFVEDDEECLQVLWDEGLAPVPGLPTERTLLMDLSPELGELRQRLDKKWRNCLSKAERSQLTIGTGRCAEIFEEFAVVYRGMLERKRFVPAADLEAHRRLQETLPDGMRMEVVVCPRGWCPMRRGDLQRPGRYGYVLVRSHERTRHAHLGVVSRAVGGAEAPQGQRHPDLRSPRHQPSRKPRHVPFQEGPFRQDGREVTFGGRCRRSNDH